MSKNNENEDFWDDKEYGIKNITHFSKKMLKLVARESGFTKKECDEYISIENVKGIIEEHAKKNSKGRLIINEEITNTIFEKIENWLTGFQLARMCSEGILDCYWDSEKNCMVFKKSDDYADE